MHFDRLSALAVTYGTKYLPCQREGTNVSKRKRGSGVNAKGRRKGSARFVKLDYALLDCQAGQSLSPGELAVLVRLMQRYHGTNNGQIAFSSRNAGRLANVSKDTAAKHLRTLYEKGFIRIKTKSSFGRNGRKATEYYLTMFPIQQGHPAPRDFQRWEPPLENKPSYQSKGKTAPKSGHKPILRVVG